MAKEGWELSDEQWARIEPSLPTPKPSTRGGRPRADDRAYLEALLWLLRSGAQWKDGQERFPSSFTCWRRLRDWEESFVDASFAPAERGGSASALPTAGKGRCG